jgi:hypothetical protein
MTALVSQEADQPGHVPDAVRMADANINPQTGLSTDYLNHFNEAIMLLEMLPQLPECVDDFFAWEPMTYEDHFAASGLKERDLAIACYETSDPDLRLGLYTLANTMMAILVARRDTMRAGLPTD